MGALPVEVRVDKSFENNELELFRGLVGRLLTLLCVVTLILTGWGPAGAAGDEADRDKEPAKAERTTGRVDQAERTSAGQAAAPKLSFTDEDLKKYQRPKSDGEEDAAVLEGTDPDDGTGDAVKASRPPAPQGAPLVRTPIAIAKPPADDPLKEYKDREAREKFRAQQVETLRTRIAGLEKRLAYLNEKRLAIIDPLRIMPQPQGTDEAAKEDGLGSADLLAVVDAEIETTESSLKSARDSLVAIETRFAPEKR